MKSARLYVVQKATRLPAQNVGILASVLFCYYEILTVFLFGFQTGQTLRNATVETPLFLPAVYRPPRLATTSAAETRQRPVEAVAKSRFTWLP